MKRDTIHIKLTQRIYRYLMLIVVALIGYACATITPIPGGAKDETPPQINHEKSTKNNQTNFTGKSFELVFDEWIQIKDKSQILVSPPLTFTPVIGTVGKKLTIDFNEEEVLKPNTTYVIQLGQSIKDFTEGNIISGYNHVFSTGDYIDSLSINGKVVDAFTGDDMEGITVMLYDTEEDSIVYKERPYYVAISDKTGVFKFSNLKSSDFKIIALQDENLNFLFDPSSEKIGYIDSLITVDTMNTTYNLSLFQEEQAFKFLSSFHNKNGLIKLQFNTPLDSNKVILSDSTTLHKSLIKEDSLLIWYKADSIKPLSIYVLEDTIKVKYLKKSFTALNSKLPRKTQAIHPSSSFKIEFDHWLESIDTSFIQLQDTSKTNIPYSIKIDSLMPTKVELTVKWKEGQSYLLHMLPKAIMDFHSNTNDTIETNIKINSLDEYGTIILNLKQLDSLYDYKLTLLKGKDIIDTFTVVSGIDSTNKVFDRLLEGDYQLEIIEDKDKNGRWTPGNYLEKQHSESFRKTKIGTLRKNWDLEFEYSYYPIKSMVLDSINTTDSINVNSDNPVIKVERSE